MISPGGPLRVFLSAGEASGDALGAQLLEALRRRACRVEAFGMGGPALRAAGLEARADMEAVSVTGLVDVLPRLPRLLALVEGLAREVTRWRPDVIILVDLPDFHYRLARRLRPLGIPVIQYVGPSIWAWRPGRAARFRQVVEEVLVLYPFEVEPWARAGVAVTWVGHPLVDVIQAWRKSPWPGSSEARPGSSVLALLPGSRPQELRSVLPVLLEAARGLPRVSRCVVPIAPGLDPDVVAQAVAAAGLGQKVTLVEGSSEVRWAAIAEARAAAVCAGTATLEVALLGKPMVVVYRTDRLTWSLLRPLVRVPSLGLPNLLLGGGIVPELLQDALTPTALTRALERVMGLEGVRQVEASRRLWDVLRLLGSNDVGASADRAAEAVLSVLRRKR